MIRSRILSFLTLLLIGLGVLGWFALMERRTVAVPRASALDKEPFLLARRLLELDGRRVVPMRTLAQALGEAGRDDVLLLPRRFGPLEPREAGELGSWIRRGGTLVTVFWKDSSAVLDDGLLADLERDRDGRLDSLLTSPGLARPLRVQPWRFPLLRRAGDDSGRRVARLSRGSGTVLVAGESGWIENESLRERDHAELLVELLAGAKARRILLVENQAVPPWYRWLWLHAWPLVLGLAGLAVLWFWHGLPRRVPLRDPRDGEVPGLRGHVEASGRWWWGCEDGPEHLVGRIREETWRRLLLRHPQWAPLPLGRRCDEVALRWGLAREEVRLALEEPIGREPAAFTRMLRVLQRLEERR